MSLAAGSAVALAAALDRTLSEPPARLHPVAWLGRTVELLDDALPDSRPVGVVVAVVVPLAFAAVAAGVVLAAAGTAAMLATAGTGELLAPSTVDPRLGPVVTAVTAAAGGVLFVCTSRRMLVGVADDVIGVADADPEAARREVRALAGRDASALSPGELRSAAVESAAENLADGLIAPLLAFGVVVVLAAVTGLSSVGVLALAAGAAAWVKAVNTLDSMLGYRDRRSGWAPARLDDAVMWLPARVAALLIGAVGAPGRSIRTVRRARPATRRPASPNSGWPMATIAAALEVRLTKPGAYTLFPDDELPAPDEAREGVRIVSRAGWLGIAAVAIAVVVV
ncbi:CobD/CbiB family cobalamin biosynthesis protein [Halorubrum sp. DTA98]|uniref:CobD/CbiB family cobalamin biosynthesis protein n=1 Tax=Halorubrum sp. DTA98 TaxID=3402163 RepID=UPI003AAA69A7